MPSFVWKYFTKIEPGKAKCNVNKCIELKSIASGTAGLIYHLKHSHGIVDKKNPAQNSEINPPEGKRQKTMNDFYKYRSIGEAMSRLAAESGLTFGQIANTSLI